MATLARSLKTSGKRALHGLFAVGQRLGFDLLPRHFYSQIPDLALLKSTTGWRAPMPMTGVLGAELDHQLAFLNQTVTDPVRSALDDRPVHAEAVHANRSDGGYGPIEAEFLYAFVRTWKPTRVVQVGCGVSTAIIRQAAEDAGAERLTLTGLLDTALHMGVTPDKIRDVIVNAGSKDTEA